jgi:hypothetical protein
VGVTRSPQVRTHGTVEIGVPMTGQTRFLFAEAAGAIRRIEEKGAAGESDTEAISTALADDDAAKALAVAQLCTSSDR